MELRPKKRTLHSCGRQNNDLQRYLNRNPQSPQTSPYMWRLDTRSWPKGLEAVQCKGDLGNVIKVKDLKKGRLCRPPEELQSNHVNLEGRVSPP